MFGGFHMGGGWFWLITILLILIVGFFAWQVYSSNNERSRETYPKRDGRSKTAREIADERYARGEISREEYKEIVEDIESHNAPS